MASTRSFGGSLLADARGRLAAAWTTIPTGAGHRRSYFWDGKHVTALTDGSRHASVSMAVDPGGAIALAVSEASPGGRPGQVWVRRGTFDRGLGAPADAGGLQNGALALGQGGAVVVAGSLPGVAGAFAPVTAVSVSSGSSAAFLPAVTLPPAPVAAPNVAATRGPVAGFGPRNTVIAATSTLNCRVGTGDLSEPCSPGVDGSTLQVWLWPASGTAPGAPIVPTTARFAGEPTIVTSGGATWLGWFEAATQRMDTLAVAHVTATGLGTVRRLRLAAAERPGAYDIPTAAPAPGGGVRFYLPATTKRSSALHTVVLSRAGRFGATSTVVAGARWAAPNTWMTPIPATGQVRDLVGWVTADDRHAPIARLAQR